MQQIYEEINSLDARCVSQFGLSEELMMEHAAISMEAYIRANLPLQSSIFILCGAGNNGADGIALGRLLHNDFDVKLYIPFGTKSHMAKVQLQRAKLLHVNIVESIEDASCYVDALFGSGLSREFDPKTVNIIEAVNKKNGLKIACDIPSGLSHTVTNKTVFKASHTITMGALKTALFTDIAKDFIGTLEVANLGVSRKHYEIDSDTFLLEKEDIRLPRRETNNTNKGNFGHLCVISGEKEGAALLCAEAGFAFGAGLVSLLGENLHNPPHIMSTKEVPKNATSIVCGMGLGSFTCKDILLSTTLPLVLDADILSSNLLVKILNHNPNAILTPHPKEFSKMLKVLGLGEKSVDEIQNSRIELAREFSKQFPQTLVLKGANTIIAQQGVCYISPFGNPALAKGGSGDVLAGLIGSLLAQGYSLKEAAISGVLAHSISADNFSKNSYSLTPQDIIEGIKCL